MVDKSASLNLVLMGYNPSQPDFPRCLDINYEDPDPPMVNTNDCGCPIPASPRRAAGCVRVQDTQFAGQAGEFPGVRRVRVIGVNKLYDIRRTYTDDMGCFQLPGKANFSGKAWFVVRFKSPRGEISRLSLLRPWDLFWAMTFIAPPTTIPFNDIQITFDEEDEEFRNGRGQWAAATVNNALHEYHDFMDLITHLVLLGLIYPL